MLFLAPDCVRDASFFPGFDTIISFRGRGRGGSSGVYVGNECLSGIVPMGYMF